MRDEKIGVSLHRFSQVDFLFEMEEVNTNYGKKGSCFGLFIFFFFLFIFLLIWVYRMNGKLTF